LQKKLILFNILVITACNYLPENIGKENEIIVIISPEDREIVEPQILDLFSHTIYTPQPETEFSIKFKNPWEIKNVNKYTNLVIVSLDFPVDSTGDLLMAKITSINNQYNNLFILKDLYARNQIVCAIHTEDAISMESMMKKNKYWMLNEFRSAQYERIISRIHKYGNSSLISEKIQDIFDYNIHLHPDYNILKYDSLKPFIWIGRGNPYRWITIHKSNKNIFKSSMTAWPEIVKIYFETLPSINISENFRIVETLNYNNKKRHIMRGIYEHKESDSGGPFFVYIFDNESENEVILVSGFVNYPGHEKLLLLKQLEVIAFTIHKGEI
jgi:hypothetical protein